jgi:integrase
MSLKGSRTTADFLPWNDMLVLVQKLERDGDMMFSLLIALGCYTGLRISDIKKLRWKDVQGQSQIHITEHKTGKLRTVHLHEDVRDRIEKTCQEIAPFEEEFIFVSSHGSVYSIQYINRKLKNIASTYKLDIRFSTHSFRKTFGRRIWSKNGYSEKSLILLSQIFNHSNVAITKRYLGIRDKEIKDVYLSL